MKNKTTPTGWGRGEADTQRTTRPASPLAQPVEVVLFSSGSCSSHFCFGQSLEYPIQLSNMGIKALKSHVKPTTKNDLVCSFNSVGGTDYFTTRPRRCDAGYFNEAQSGSVMNKTTRRDGKRGFPMQLPASSPAVSFCSLHPRSGLHWITVNLANSGQNSPFFGGYFLMVNDSENRSGF